MVLSTLFSLLRKSKVEESSQSAVSNTLVQNKMIAESTGDLNSESAYNKDKLSLFNDKGNLKSNLNLKGATFDSNSASKVNLRDKLNLNKDKSEEKKDRKQKSKSITGASFIKENPHNLKDKSQSSQDIYNTGKKKKSLFPLGNLKIKKFGSSLNISTKSRASSFSNISKSPQKLDDKFISLDKSVPGFTLQDPNNVIAVEAKKDICKSNIENLITREKKLESQLDKYQIPKCTLMEMLKTEDDFNVYEKSLKEIIKCFEGSIENLQKTLEILKSDEEINPIDYKKIIETIEKSKKILKIFKNRLKISNIYKERKLLEEEIKTITGTLPEENHDETGSLSEESEYESARESLSGEGSEDENILVRE